MACKVLVRKSGVCGALTVDLVAGGLKVKWHALGWKELIKEFAANGIGAELVETEAA